MGSRPAARRGLTAYNHNLDTSREYYPEVRRRRGSHRTSRARKLTADSIGRSSPRGPMTTGWTP